MVQKIIQSILAIGIVIASVSCEIEVRKFTQPLDHFNVHSKETWDNTYFIDESFYKPGGPIFLYVGDMQFFSTSQRLSSSHFTDIAREVGALLVGTEHRYFGDSHPVPDLTIENLAYLTSSQALEDIVALVYHIKSSSPALQNAKIIAAGIGQGGALATWLRQRYPDLISGVWASSARLNALLNFKEFLTTTSEIVKVYGGLLCHDSMSKAFSMVEDVFQDRNFAKLKEVFRLCPSEDNFDDELTAGLFFGTAATTIGVYINMLHSQGVTNFCGYLEKGTDPMTGLADWINNAIYHSRECVPASVDDLLGIYMESDWTASGVVSGGRQQLWQICNEFGWFRSSSGADHPFGHRFPYELFFQQCSLLHGSTITEEEVQAKIDHTNALFGGLTPDVTRVYFTNGELDSGRTLGIMQDLNREAPADTIPYFGYGADFASMETTKETTANKGLRAVQERARSLILQWLRD